LSIFPVERIPFFVLPAIVSFSVLLAMVLVFCVISHYVLVRVPCFCHRIRVRFLCFSLLFRVRVLCYQPSCARTVLPATLSVSVFCVLCFSHHVRVLVRVLCYQPSCSCPCSMFCVLCFSHHVRLCVLCYQTSCPCYLTSCPKLFPPPYNL